MTIGSMSRRAILRLGASTVSGLALAQAHKAELAAQDAGSAEAEDVDVIVGDVLDYQLANEGAWAGHFGSVTLRMHAAFYDGDDVWYIRTDASDNDFAVANGLVYVPLLARALDAEGSFADIFFVSEGVDGQRAIVSTIPANEDFTPAFRINNVTFTGDPRLLTSVAAVLSAVADGSAIVEPTSVVVNYPLVLWPGGGLPVDPDLVNPLGPGILISEPDTTLGTVTFKLHQCYPGSRYIATDTSAVPMAGMMGIAGSAPTQLLIEAGATAPIYVFGNGVPGPAAMGFQPSIFNSKAGDVIWSPFWEHFTVVWNDGATPEVLTSEADVLERAADGELTIYPGTPDTGGQSFVVNCPAPILAPNDFDASEFAAESSPVAG